MTIKIDKEIPIPGPRYKYPFSEMDVGDSIAISAADANSMRSSAKYHSEKTGKKFISRTDGDKVRLWRVK